MANRVRVRFVNEFHGLELEKFGRQDAGGVVWFSGGQMRDIGCRLCCSDCTCDRTAADGYVLVDGDYDGSAGYLPVSELAI